MGNSTPASQTVVNKTEVDPQTAAWKNALFGEAGSIYNQGAPGYYPNSTVTPYSDQTWQGLDMLQGNAARGAVGLDQAYGAVGQMMQPGYSPGMQVAGQAAYGGMQNMDRALIAQSAGQSVAGQAMPMLQGYTRSNPYGSMVAQQGMTPTTAGVGELQSMANGGANPYLDQLYSQGAEKVRNAVNAQFSAAGRSGPNAAHAQGLANGLGDLYTSIYAPAYEQDMSRRMQAAGQLAGIQQADRAAGMQGLDTAGQYREAQYGRQLQGAQFGADLYGQDAARRDAAASQLAGLTEAGFDRQLQGASMMGDLTQQQNAQALDAMGMLPSLYSYGEMPGKSMIGVGGAYETLADQYLQGDIDRWNYEQNLPYSWLGQYANIVNGLPVEQSSTQRSTQLGGTNRAMGALGGAASGASLGSSFGPWGAAIGGVLGGLGGLRG